MPSSAMVQGNMMSSYLATRPEYPLRNAIAPVILLEYTRMHPTVDAYIGIWRFVSANKIDVTDKTWQVQAPSCSVNLGNTSRTRDMACLTE